MSFLKRTEYIHPGQNIFMLVYLLSNVTVKEKSVTKIYIQGAKH